MSKAIICDRCGLILPVDGDIRTIYMENPVLFKNGEVPNGDAIDLCRKCFEKFEIEYMANLMEIPTPAEIRKNQGLSIFDLLLSEVGDD